MTDESTFTLGKVLAWAMMGGVGALLWTVVIQPALELLRFYAQEPARITLEVVGLFTVMNTSILLVFLGLWMFGPLADVSTFLGECVDQLRGEE